jgi:hypothetical protein
MADNKAKKAPRRAQETRKVSSTGKIEAGSTVRPVGFVTLSRDRRGKDRFGHPIGPMEAHVPHGYDYVVTATAPGVPPWDLSAKQIRADVAQTHAEHFEVVPAPKKNTPADEPAEPDTEAQNGG